MLYDLTLLLLAAYLASENVEALEETLVPVKKKMLPLGALRNVVGLNLTQHYHENNVHVINKCTLSGIKCGDDEP